MDKKHPVILSHNFTGRTLVVVWMDNSIHTKIVESSHPNWKQVLRAYKAGNFAAVIELIDVAQAINKKFNGRFLVKNGKVLRDGQEVHGYLMDRILFFMREGLSYQRLLKFADNLYANPSERSRNELYAFLEHQNMPITDDGCFLAYKGVAEDYFSITSGDIKVLKGKVEGGRIFNGVGEVIIVERSDVNDNPNQGCSRGLHVGSWEYANGFKSSNGHLMVVKVNPKNVVSVPFDESHKKCRACEYEVIAEENRKLEDVRDSNFDKVAKVKQQLKRDALGRFCS